MKLLLASTSSGSRGGGELYLLYLGRALAARGHDVTLWASDHERMDELAEAFRVFGEVSRSPYQNTYDRRGRSLASYLDRAGARRIAEEWKRGGYDLVHVNKQNLEDGLDLLRAATASGLPTLATIHLTQSARYLKARIAPARDWIARRALRRYPGLMVTVLAQRRRDLASFLGSSSSTRNIANGVPIFDLSRREEMRERRRAELGLTEADCLFVGVGRMVPQKRPMVFLDLAERVLKVMPEAAFVWVGDGKLTPEWDAWVAERKLASRIRRLPWHRDVPSVLLAADVFMHTADFEGLPLAVLEAMSAALPCAITPNLLAEMPFLNETNSVAADHGTSWIARLQSAENRRALGATVRRLAEEEFSFERMAAEYERHYEESIAAWR